MNSITGYLATYGGAAFIGLCITPLVSQIARVLGVIDAPNHRKVHGSPVPRVGGLAIAIATTLPLLIWAAMLRAGVLKHFHSPSASNIYQLAGLLTGAACVLLVGLLDDIYELPSKYKLLALVAGAAVLCSSGGTIQSIIIGGHDWLDLGIAAWPITMLWIVGVTVSINFIDGLDGLAAGIVLIGALILAVTSATGGYWPGTVLALALAGALSAFLVFNFNPASIFMGDCGSMFIGFLLAGGCVLAGQSVGTTRSIILPAIALSVPLCDTLFTMVRRGVLQRRSLFAAERGHIHHRLLDSGLCHKHVVLLLYLATLAGALVAIVGLVGNAWAAIAIALLFDYGLWGLFRTAGSLRAKETLLAVRRNRALSREGRRYQNAFYDLQLRFREVRNVDQWWKLLCHAGDVLDFGKIDIEMTRRDGSEAALRWRRDDQEIAATTSITAEVPIPQRRTGQTLRAAVEVLVADFLESGGHRVALFSRLISEFGLDRLPLPSKTKSVNPGVLAEVAPAHHTDADAQASGPFANLRVAIVHDFLYTYAGAERVLEQLIEVFPHADLFSLFDFLPADQRGFIKDKPVTCSFLQRMPFARRKHRAYLPLMPLAIEQMDVSNYDLVISSSYVAAKGIITRHEQLHICYCHTPVRFAWDLQRQYLGQVGLATGIRSMAAKLILHYIRNWDVHSAQGVDIFLTNSDFVGRRIQKLYRRPSTTIYPPVNVDGFAFYQNKEDYYLTASRMVPYKRIDLIVEAFSQMPHRRLLVVGDGPELERIKAKCGSNITLLGHESDADLRKHMQLAKAFVFAAEEDFGITPVEAQACGTPVIAFGRGGVTESVIAGKTGVFFESQTVESIADAVDRFESQTWDPLEIRQNAERFSPTHFRREVTNHVRKAWVAFQSSKILARCDRGELVKIAPSVPHSFQDSIPPGEPTNARATQLAVEPV